MQSGTAGSALRHVLGVSGGKDSAALAIYLKDRIPNLEYFFCDTKKELRETYEFLDRLERALGRPIKRLNAERGFDHWLKVYGHYLPSSRMRWCTRMLKLKPFEEFVGDDEALSYIAIRADENRDGYISSKPNIKPIYPFREEGIVKEDVIRILDSAGIGLPTYYEWRTRSGCYFCFFQRKVEWVGLLERHPDLYEQAKAYEKMVPEDGKSRFTWSQGESLEDLQRPERIAEIKANHEAQLQREKTRRPNQRLLDVFGSVLDDEDDAEPCVVCSL